MPKSTPSNKTQADYSRPLFSEGVCATEETGHLTKDIQRHIISSLGSDPARKLVNNYYLGLALAVRDRLVMRWLSTQRAYYDQEAKRIYYLSLEYLPGKSLMNNLHCLGLVDEATRALSELGLDLEELAEAEWDAGLGNGGLGRLASCYLDSMATLGLPGYGYGIRYDYGIFHQVIRNGSQVEMPDNWTQLGTPWEYQRGRYLFDVRFGGRVESFQDYTGRTRYRWVHQDVVRAMACDMLVPGYRNGNVINMRLWSARSDSEFNLDFFNTGKYIDAVRQRIQDETISKVLYPSEEKAEGQELRLKQQYFFVAATMQDILRRHRKHDKSFGTLPDRVAIQLNDTHPSIAVAEMMRLFLDEEQMEWDAAWDICTRTFAYTNHTILPEALETWPVALMRRILPRHFMLIEEINRRFLNQVEARYPGDNERKARLSILAGYPGHSVRMSHLAIVGSHKVNGVSALHGDILKHHTFHEFHELFPGRITHVTNGVTPRRWIKQANPPLAALLDEVCGPGWVTDLDRLTELEPLAEDPGFGKRWRAARTENKKRLAGYVERKMGVQIDRHSLFDVQIKRIHEYKRQILNVLHVVTLAERLRQDPGGAELPRTVFFGGKAAPAYWMAKQVIRLINGVSRVVAEDPALHGRLQVIFLPNYCVSQAERIIPATDLSEQISMAGMEASGTGNMKFGLNGALTIGTLDGANVEMLEAVGQDNIYIFGHATGELDRMRDEGYDPGAIVANDPELGRTLESIARGDFSPEEPGRFRPLVDALTHQDNFFVLADYHAYMDCQGRVSACFRDQDHWTRCSILNTARLGRFSSDRAVAEYARDIWNTRPVFGLAADDQPKGRRKKGKRK